MNKCKTCVYWGGLQYHQCFPREQTISHRVEQCTCRDKVSNFLCRSSSEVLLLAPRDARPVGMFTGEDYGCVNHERLSERK
jgi:hypothetical protein